MPEMRTLTIGGIKFEIADDTAVRFDAQTLTEDQKAQARANIGAISSEDVAPKLVSYSANMQHGRRVDWKNTPDESQPLWATSDVFELKSGAYFAFDGTFIKAKLVTINADGKVSASSGDITSGTALIESDGCYAINVFKVAGGNMTDDDVALLDSTVTVNVYESAGSGTDKFGIPAKPASNTLRYKPIVDGDEQTTKAELRDDFGHPLTPVWGHEYLQHWYERVYEAQADSATVVLDGDSITAGYVPSYEGVDDTFVDMRGYAIKKIMKAGNYPSSKLTVFNNGHGGRKTGEWVGNTEYGEPSYISQYPNGFLHDAMAKNPDLLIIAWGMNDADKTNAQLSGLDTEGRLEVFKNNMIEGLKRIRGNVSVNGRPSYNKPTSELSIIICMPTVGGTESTGRGNLVWNQYIREILIPLCREYECAFADFTFRTYAHDSMSPRIWSGLTASGGRDGIHPNKYSNAQTMSLLQDLIYPVCMWNIDMN